MSCRNEDYGKEITGVPEKNEVMTSHYVTLTGVILDRESDNEWLRIQTWGEQYYLLYNDFVEYNKFNNNLASGTTIIIN